MPMNPRLLRPTASGFDPRRIAGLAGWWDASDSSTVTLDTGVSALADKSGLGRNATQSTGNNQPAYGTTQLAGKNVMTFDGTNDTLVTASITVAQPLVMFAVARSALLSGSRMILGGSGSNQPLLYQRSSLDWTISAAGSGSAELRGGIVSTNWTFLSARFNGANSFVRANGTQLAAGTTGVSGFSVGLALGSQNNSNFWNGDIAEVLLYGALLSDLQVERIEKYLKGKWGL
jgi:hypothetical protein